jgi:hypothetical protein
MKEQLIREYLSRVNFNGQWSLTVIREDMKKFLGETPGIEVSYVKDAQLNESGDETIEVELVDQVTVVFTNDVDKLQKMSFGILGKKG